MKLSQNVSALVLITSFFSLSMGFPPPSTPPMCTVVSANDPMDQALENHSENDGTFGEALVELAEGVERMSYQRKNGYAVIDDIVLAPLHEIEGNLKSNVIVSTQMKWVNKTVPCEITSNLPNQQRVWDAIKHWQQYTQIKFVPRRPEHSQYVRFMPGTGCLSYIGRRQAGQEIWLANGCRKEETIHEIGHAVGLWHEHVRFDRDAFVQIRWENISPGQEDNFTKHVNGNGMVEGYDYKSIMHYRADAFSKNGQPTIRSITGTAVPPLNGKVLSRGDRRGVATMYNYPLPE